MNDKIAKVERKLKEIATKKRRLETMEKKYRRSLAALRRWDGKTKEKTVEPALLVRAINDAVPDLREPILAEELRKMREWAARFAKIHGFKVRVRWHEGVERSGCRMKSIAHIHYNDGYRPGFRSAYYRRGTICVSRDAYLRSYKALAYDAKHLMAHEVSHLVKGASRWAHLDHGKDFDARCAFLLQTAEPRCPPECQGCAWNGVSYDDEEGSGPGA